MVALAALGLYVIFLFATSNALADFLALRASVETEEELINHEAQSIAAKLEQEQDESQNVLLNRIGNRLVAALPTPTRYTYRFFVVPGEPNAMSIPTGTILVTDGMFDLLQTEEQMAAVLAHEIEHAEKRHFLRQLFRDNGLTMLRVLIFGIAQDSTTKNLHKLIGLKYSRDMETEADFEGARLLIRAHYPPKAMIEVLDRLADQDGGWSPVLLSTHPDGRARAKRVGNLPEVRQSVQ